MMKSALLGKRLLRIVFTPLSANCLTMSSSDIFGGVYQEFTPATTALV
jgi:hypothetical protein